MFYLEKIKNQYLKSKEEYENAKVKALENLKYIENGYKFGELNIYRSEKEYFPLEFIRIIDRENCVIEVYEFICGSRHKKLICTYDLYIVK